MSYEGAADKELRRDLEAKLRPHISYLTECRPMSVSMRNAIKFVKLTISNLDPSLTEKEAKEEIAEQIDNFIRARIDLAVDEITKLAADKVSDGDVILLFNAATSVENALRAAHTAGKRFRVIVVDTRPQMHGVCVGGLCVWVVVCDAFRLLLHGDWVCALVLLPVYGARRLSCMVWDWGLAVGARAARV